MATPRRSDEWPTPYEYDEALLKHQETFIDPDIQSSKLLKTTNTKPARLNGSGSQHVCVYRLDKWVVRCFTADIQKNIHPPEDIVQRYEGILAYLDQPGNNIPFLIKHEWIERGIKMRGTHFPFLKLSYLAEAPPLGKFLSDLYDQQQPTMFAQTAGKLAQEWLNIIQQLEKRQIAHGDLDTSNILVHGTYPLLSLYLIDYDGMYVPSFVNKGMHSADKGHENFQPANARLRTFGPEIDRFSALIIYLSLYALTLKPSLWENCGATESCLLLGHDDFEHLGQSKRFRLLYQESKGDQRLRSCLDELQRSQEKCMPRSLSEILNVYVRPPRIQTPPDPGQDQEYTGIPLAVPLDWATGTGATPLPQPPLLAQESLPTPPASPWSQQPLPVQPVPPTSPVAPARRNTGHTFLIVAAIIIILAIVLGLLIYFVSHSQQPSSSFVLLMTLSPLLIGEDDAQKRDPDDEE